MGRHRFTGEGETASALIARLTLLPDDTPTTEIPAVEADTYPPSHSRRRLYVVGTVAATLAGTGAAAAGLGVAPQFATIYAAEHYPAPTPVATVVDLPDRGALAEALAARRLSQLAASRAAADADRVAAAEIQAAAETAAQQAQEAAEKEAQAQEAAKAAEAAQAVVLTAGGAPSPTGEADITNSAGPVSARAQAAADALVRNIPGAAGITMGGTRPSAIDMAGHPSGNAIDYMVGVNNVPLGEAIVAYHIANWDALGVEYIIYRQRILMSPGGAWEPMEDRGSVTQNHMDHPHVNYRP